MKGTRLLSAFALLAVGLATGCGGGGDSSSAGATPAEAHNEAILEEAESTAETEEAVIGTLADRLGVYEYAGVDEAFAVPDENRCSVQGVHTGDELQLYEDQGDLLLSPDGEVGVDVGIFVGSQLALCLKAAGMALGWTGEPITPSGPLSRDEFIRRADAICAPANELAEELFGDIESWDDEARASSEFRLTAVRMVDELAALEAPASLRAQADRYTELSRKRLDVEMEELQAAAKIAASSSIGEDVESADEKAYNRAAEQREANYRARHKVAGEIGLQVCAS